MDFTHRFAANLPEPEKNLVPTRPRRVFVAEDDPEMRAFLSSVFARRGYEVTDARSGAHALELLGDVLLGLGSRRFAPDLVVTDQCMPGCDGLELIEALREIGASMPIILITAFGDDDLMRRAIAAGATAVLDKPFDASLLIAMARRLTTEVPAMKEERQRG